MPKDLIRDHIQVPITNFKGLYSRGLDDAVPPGYFIDSLNTAFEQIEVRTRDGFTKEFTLANIRRFFIYKRLNETVRYLILDTSGNLWDSLYGTPLVTNVAYVDFSAVNFLNRAYITFHNRVTGIAGQNIQVYEGSGPGTLRPAAGAAPIGFTFTAPVSLNIGHLSPGYYIAAVVYETTSGFLTSPGPLGNFAITLHPGGQEIGFTPLPIGPAGTVARRVIITKSVPADIWTASPNPLGYEFFFLPNGRVADNTTTTLPNIDFFDDDLIDSADYLFDNRATIPCGLGITIYSNRAVVWGIPGFEHYAFVSKALEVEVFDETAGLLYLDPSDASSQITNTVDHENSLLLQTQDRTYISGDNGGDPDTWSCDPLDKAIGAEVFSVSKILDSRGTSVKRFFQGDKSGIYCYESGGFSDPAFTFNVEDIWKRINKAQFNKVQLCDDPKGKVVFAAIPLDNSTECSHILVGDYSNSFNRYGEIVATLVRWSLWAFPWSISTIAVDFNSDKESALKQSGFAGNIYVQDSSLATDNNIKITSYIQTHLLWKVLHFIHHFGFLEFRGQGNGNISIYLYGMNNQQTGSSPDMILTATPGLFYQTPINFVDAKMSVKLMCNTNAGDSFTIFDISVDVKPKWAETARV